MRRILTFACLMALASTVGCGMEYTDKRARYRPTTDLDHGVNVEPDKMVCPNMILLREGGKGAVSDLQRGQVQDAFGPFVPCNTTLDGSGTCTNPDCGQKYAKATGEVKILTREDVQGEARQAVMERLRRGAESNRTYEEKDSKQVTVSPVPAFLCPYEDCGKVISIGSGGLERETGKNAQISQSYCYHENCKRFVTFSADDITASVTNKEELLCPNCSSPVDPTLRLCGNKTCKLKGKLLNTNPADGPCWSCGAVGTCPNCQGSGTGSVKSYDTVGWKEDYPNVNESTAPSYCYYCFDDKDKKCTGLCPECEGSGFIEYDPSLPLEFQMHSGKGDQLKVVKATARKWQHPQEGKSSGGGGEGGGAGEGGGGEGE